MKYIYLMAAVCLLVNLSACKSAREIRLYEEYPAKTELPVILKTSKEIYEGQYVYFGRIEISSTDEMRALETAAKYGADGVGLVSIGMVKDAYSYEHRKVQEADGSWSIETTTYKTPNAYYVDGIGISLYRHDPSQDRYTRWFRNCYDIRREISSYKPVCDNETLSYLLSKGVDPNIQDLNGKTALYNVVKSIRTQTQKQSASEGSMLTPTQISFRIGMS